MPKVKISEYSATANSNTDVASINIDEGCAPSGINNAIRAIMGHLKDFQSGTSNDPFTVGSSGSLTLSYGTANGVAYLNGSKVLTTGSALVFDGTNLGVGVSPASDGAIHVHRAGASFPTIKITNGTTGTGNLDGFDLICGSGGEAYVYNRENQPILFGVNNSEQMRLDSSGNLLVGVTSNTGVDTGVQRLVVTGIAGGAGGALGLISDSLGRNIILTDSSKTAVGAININSTSMSLGTNNGYPLVFNTNGTERARIDSSGNLGLGVTPSAIFTDYKGIQLYNATGMGMYGSGYGATVTSNAYPSATGSVYTRGGNSYRPTKYSAFDGAHTWSYAAAAGTTISWTDAMTLDASGRLLLGTTSAVGQLTVVASPTATARSVSYSATGGTIDYYIVNGSNTGSISTNTTTTSYVTSSDYRLKNTIAPMTGALVKLAQLKPVTYKWNTDGSDGEGFIAHELAQVVPQCVTGEKDAVDADGKPVYQGIDTSFLVATLTAAIQEQQAIIQSLTARITALEGA